MEILAHPTLLAVFLIAQVVLVGNSIQSAKGDVQMAASITSTAIIILTLLTATWENVGYWFVVHILLVLMVWLCALNLEMGVARQIALVLALMFVGLLVSGGVGSNHAPLIWAMNVVAVSSVTIRHNGGIKTVLGFSRGWWIAVVHVSAWLVALTEKREWLAEKGLLGPVESVVSWVLVIVPVLALLVTSTIVVVYVTRGLVCVREYARLIVSPSIPTELNNQLQKGSGA